MFEKYQLAKRYGISIRTLERWLDEGRLPVPKRVGNIRIWPESELVEWEDARYPGIPNGHAQRLAIIAARLKIEAQGPSPEDERQHRRAEAEHSLSEPARRVYVALLNLNDARIYGGAQENAERLLKATEADLQEIKNLGLYPW